ncbi:uncharacterized protein LOC144910994 [Branchiostoma floridae x Branchiostoma belcheri]
MNETFVVSVRENAPVGTKIGKVSADDADAGRNGYVTYSISPGSEADMFLVDGETGEISTIVSLDYESLAKKTISLVVVARDKGVPSLSASAAVEVAVLDTNDHCPTFQDDSTSIQHTLRPGQSLTITATDRDSGANGQVMYSILGEGNNNRYSVNESTGVITLRDDITPGRYTFVVVAIDQAAVPCSSRLTVTVIVEEEGIPVPEQVLSSTVESRASSSPVVDVSSIVPTQTFMTPTPQPTAAASAMARTGTIASSSATSLPIRSLISLQPSQVMFTASSVRPTPSTVVVLSAISTKDSSPTLESSELQQTAPSPMSVTDQAGLPCSIQYLSVQVSPITVTVTAVESLPVPVRETVKVTAVESIPVRETVTVTAVESLPVRETVTVTAVESMPVRIRETVKVTAVESVPVRETVTVTAVQSIPVRETVKVTAMGSPVCETVTVTAVQSIAARETVKVTAVESIPVRQLVTVTAVESMPVRETVTVKESIPERETVTVKSTPVCETVTVTAVESIPVRQPVTVTAAASMRVRETVTVTESVLVRETVTVTESIPVQQTVTVTAVESIPVRETVLSTVQSCASTISPSRPTMTRTPQSTAASSAVPMLTSPTSTIESPTAGSEFLLRNVDMSMVLDEAWDEDLTSQSSEKYKRRSSDIAVAMSSVFRNDSRFVGVIVTQFREGSTVADFQLLHNGGENFDDVAASMLRQATRNGLQVGGAKVTQLEQKDEETSDTSQAFDIRWLGLLGIFPVIIMIAIAIAIQTQKKREKKRMAKRKARKQTWPYVRNMNSLRTL